MLALESALGHQFWSSLKSGIAHRAITIPISPLLIYNFRLNVADGPFCFKVFAWEIIETNEFVGI